MIQRECHLETSYRSGRLNAEPRRELIDDYLGLLRDHQDRVPMRLRFPEVLPEHRKPLLPVNVQF